VVPYFGYARQDRRVRSARVPYLIKSCRGHDGQCGRGSCPHGRPAC
jgi:hypothetical protein